MYVRMDDFFRTIIFLDAEITKFSYPWCSLVAASRERCLLYYKLLRHDGEKDDGKKRGIIPFSLFSSNPARILLALSSYILVSLRSDDGEILRRQTWSRVFGVRSPSQWGEK